ncbi:MAG: carboxypeptidase regulatory-like domain-containing protein, partial [Chitinophagaceae bacterium]
MKYTLLFLGCLFIAQINSFAQFPGGGARAGGGNMNLGHFYGKVVDANKKGIDGATVQLKGSKFDPATKKTTETIVGTMITAANGDFSFDNLSIMSPYKLVITGIGFKKFEKQISFNFKPNGNPQDMMALVDKDLGNIKLEDDATQLQSVTV